MLSDDCNADSYGAVLEWRRRCVYDNNRSAADVPPVESCARGAPNGGVMENRAGRGVAALMVVCAWTLALSCVASQPSLTECFEGSDFVGNAALSRENGMSEKKFIDRMQGDFELIHAFPQELRWFAHDAGDEAFLMAAAREVFERPAPPEEHRRMFLESCLARMAAPASDDTTPAAGHVGEAVH
jgi:hypothetical protein